MNLIDYYPTFLKKSPEIIAICNAVQPEIDEFNVNAESAWRETYIDSASEYGLSRREKMLGITPSATIEQRRATVRNRYLDQRPFTEQNVRRYLDSILTSYTFEVNKTTPGLFATLTVGAGNVVPANLITQLRNIIPANIQLIIQDGKASNSRIEDEGDLMVIYNIGDDISATDISDPVYGGLIDFGGKST